MKLFRPDLENPGPDDLKAVAQFMHTLPIGWVEPVDAESTRGVEFNSRGNGLNRLVQRRQPVGQ